MNRNIENRMEMLVKRGNRRRLLKRAVALMSAVVMLFTVNTLKRTATTLERIPMCGFEYEHTHVPECFDAEGMLICQLHEHTDACYQQQPVKEAQAEAVEGDVDEVEFDLGGDAPEQVEEAVETEQPAEEACVVYGYELGAEAVRLSDIIAAAELPVALSDIEIVGMVDGEAQDWVSITPEDGDYIVRAAQDFAAAELAVVTAEDIQTVMLLNGVKAGEESEEATEEITEETVEDTVEQVEEETAGEIVGETTEQVEEAAEEAAGETEETVEENVENTEEVTEEATEEVTEEITEEITEETVEQTEEAAEEATEETAEETAEQTEEVTEEATEETAEQTKEMTGEAIEEPTEQTEEVALEVIEAPAEEVTEEPSEEVAEQTEEAAEKPAEEVTEEATEETAEQTEEVTEETAEQTEEMTGEATEETAEQTEEMTGEAIEETAEQTEEVAVEVIKAPAEEVTEEPSEEVAEQTEEAAEKPAEEVTGQATEETAEQTEEMTEEATEETAEQTEEVTEEVTEETTEQTEEVTEESAQETEQTEQTEETEEPAEETGESEPPEPETGAETSAAEYAATIDLTGAEYPLSLRALLAQAERVLDVEVEAVAQVEAPEALADEVEAAEAENTEVDETVEITDAAETTEAIETTETVEAADTAESAEPAQESATAEWTLEYDDALIAVEAGEDDYAVAPLADFESTQIIVNNGSRYALTLVNCTLPQAEEAAPEITYPAQSFEGRTDSVKVSVTAAEGAFPEGTAMVVADVEDEQTLSDIEQTVGEDFVEVKRVHAVDISFYNAEGEEIEPLIPISVVMTVDEIEQQQDAVVVHVDSEGAAEVVEQSEAPEADGAELNLNVEMPAAPAEETAAPIEENIDTEDDMTGEAEPEEAEVRFEADSFSVYAVVVTETIETRYIAADGATWNISVGYGPEAGIPGGATLAVRELEGEESEDCLAQTAELLKGRETITLARFFDITILDAEGNEVQPAEPVKVDVALADGSEDAVKAVHFAEEGLEVIEASQEEDAVRFEAEGFSVYGIVYTVDFEYSVNGKMYQFSLPGGGFVSFTDLVEVLGIIGDMYSEENGDENRSTIVENAEENSINVGAEENSINSDTNTALTLGDVEVSEATKKFVTNVTSIEFSSPELVDVSKVEADITVGQIKENRGLECEYSAELTEEQIAEINAQTVEAGDWALISVQPFTSEEEITVTLKDGEVFSIRVTDAQIKKTVIDAKGDTWEITVTYGEDAQIPDGAELKVREMLPEDRKYEEYYQQSLKKTREGIDTKVSSDDFGYAHIFDIEILDQGQKIEPEANVSVTIKLLDTPQEIAALRVVHFSTEGPEIIDIEENKEKGGETELGFVTDEFSVYAVIEDVDHGEPDLANRTVKISVGGNYLTNQTNYNESPWRIGKTDNINQAADYQFEATNTPGVYRVYTMINGQKNYMHINAVNGNSGRVNLTSDYTMDLNVVPNTDGTYGIYRNDGGTNYYLNQYGGEGGTGFAAYADADGGGNSKLTFTSVPADPNALKAGTHIMLAKIDEYYYIVNNDGTLTSVEYIEATNQVKVENPMMWTYTGTNLYHNSDAVDFDGSMIASDYYYKYIDPSTGIGISEDNDDNTTTEIAGYKEVDGVWVPYYRIVSGTRQMQPQSALTYTNRHLKSSNGDYYIGVTEENGVLKLAGGRDSDHAVEILFASPTAVLPVDSSNHTVSHIDISIEGTSEVDVPLAYGKYYNEAGDQILEVSTNKSLKLTKEGIGISTDDMKKATIVAYIKNESGQAVPIDNAFYITGYSANAATEYSTPQVRIEGSFKVANLPVTDQDWGHRLNNKIYYSVTAVKTVTFDLIDPELGQLYDAEGNKLTITIDVAFSASFDYWDERNECPPVKWDPVYWPQGNIPGGSGMDFVLGGDAEQAGSNIVAIEISKLVVDENGNRIKPSTSTPVNNSFEIWQDADGNPNSVIGMGIDGMPINVNYGDYVNLHSKNIKVGVDGIGLVYDYDVTPGMYYIREDPSSVRDDIVDTDGNYWEYAGTRIETESPWRDDSVNDGKYHVSGIYTKDGGTYNAVPEVLGNYSDINGNTTWIDHDDGDKVKPVRNGFLEFYVYNIYKPVQTDITLKKVDKANLNDSDPDLLKGASFTVTKYSDQNFQGIDSTWGTSGSMTVSDDEKEDGTYTLNGVFEFQGLPAGYYQIEETRFPDGYIKLSGNPRFKVEENASHELVVTLINNPDNLLRLEDDKLTIIVGNTPGAALPNTGGPGTRLFTILGSILILGAGVLLWRRRRLI